jgi:hypothetical protein
MPGESQKRCFVIGPIGEPGSPERVHADWVLHGIIEPAIPAFIVERADQIAAPGMITTQVLDKLVSADLVIADLSGRNANAFYELAIRHHTGLPTIHIIREGEVIPFDVGQHRAIQFSLDSYAALSAAQKALKNSIEAALKPDFVPENPSTHAATFREVKKSASPAQQVLLEQNAAMADKLAAMALRIDRLERITPQPSVPLGWSPVSDPNLGAYGYRTRNNPLLEPTTYTSETMSLSRGLLDLGEHALRVRAEEEKKATDEEKK